MVSRDGDASGFNPVKVLIERRESLAPAAWQELLSIDEHTWADLFDRRVFEDHGDGRFHLAFVGMAALPMEFVVVLPKYAGTTTPAALPSLHKTLSHYFFRRDQQRAVQVEDQREALFRDERAYTEYHVWLTLRTWYRQHGPYRRRERQIGGNWGTVVDWPRTLGRSPAVHGEDAAIYPSPVMARSSSRPNEVTHIQISALARLEGKYLLHGETPIEQAHRAEYATLGQRLDEESGALALRVRRELGAAFRTEEISMLSVLADWLEDRRDGHRGPVVVRLFGTSRFEYVWEDACRVVLGNGPERALPAPFWTIDGAPPVASPPPRADIWATLPDLRPAVMDAKYYWPLPESRPGWGDVVKQLFYAEVCADGAGLVNAFLFPDPGSVGLARRGQVDVRERADRVVARFRPIAAYGIAPDALFTRYADGRLALDWLATVAATA